MKERTVENLNCSRCPIGKHADWNCMQLFEETYGYSCLNVPIVIEWPDGLDLKPQSKH